MRTIDFEVFLDAEEALESTALAFLLQMKFGGEMGKPKGWLAPPLGRVGNLELTFDTYEICREAYAHYQRNSVETGDGYLVDRDYLGALPYADPTFSHSQALLNAMEAACPPAKPRKKS